MAHGFTILQSVPKPRPTTNPYNIMLLDAIRAVPGVTLLDFSWRTALIGRYDAFHAHWPEILVDGHTPLKKFARQLCFVLFLLRLTITRTPIIRTLHNIGLPSGISRRERWLLTWFERRTTLVITLNESTPVPQGAESVLIPHGHYRDWYARFPREAVIDGRFGYFGMVRRYKGVEQLVEAFTALPRTGESYSLRVGGRPSSTELAETIRGLGDGDGRIGFTFDFLEPSELVALATASELVVLPYRFMHNSGGILTALSLGRPVLAPDNDVNRALAAEVGDGWVHGFTGDLDASDLIRALDAVRSDPARPLPDLSGRDWDVMGAAHVAAFRRARAILRGDGDRFAEGDRR
ncbi:glycosyltransferase [Plantibacter sp. YIM 135249]|uniref:glycosyltransferase n=1 Tax=Plantibacter sp. YIM 135249 TaxID=3423918 RepID=UPI003D3445C0